MQGPTPVFLCLQNYKVLLESINDFIMMEMHHLKSAHFSACKSLLYDRITSGFLQNLSEPFVEFPPSSLNDLDCRWWIMEFYLN